MAEARKTDTAATVYSPRGLWLAGKGHTHQSVTQHLEGATHKVAHLSHIDEFSMLSGTSVNTMHAHTVGQKYVNTPCGAVQNFDFIPN